MKRKKGAKGNLKKVKKNDPNSPSISIEGDIGEIGEVQAKSNLEVKQAISLDNKIAKASNNDPDISSFISTMKAGHSRVKVKLKTSKLLEDHKHSSDVIMPNINTPNDTNKSNSQFVMTEMNEMAFDKMDVSCFDGQTLETSNAVANNSTRKPGSIKIKSSRGSGLSGDFVKENIVVWQLFSRAER